MIICQTFSLVYRQLLLAIQVNQRPTAKLPTCASLVTVPVRASRRLLIELNQSGEAAENIKELQLESAQAQAELERKELEDKKEEERKETERMELESREAEGKEEEIDEEEDKKGETAFTALDSENAAVINGTADGTAASMAAPANGVLDVNGTSEASRAAGAGVDSTDAGGTAAVAPRGVKEANAAPLSSASDADEEVVEASHEEEQEQAQ